MLLDLEVSRMSINISRNKMFITINMNDGKRNFPYWFFDSFKQTIVAGINNNQSGSWLCQTIPEANQ